MALAGAAIGGLLVAFAAVRADAAPVTYSFTVTGAGAFTNTYSPYDDDPITPAFSGTITFDPTQYYDYTTAGITLTSTNMAYTNPLGFEYSAAVPAIGVEGTINIGTYFDNGGSPNLVAPGFDAQIYIYYTGSSVSTAQVASIRDFASAGALYTGGGTASFDVSLPEPASTAMLGVGLAGLLLARRRRGEQPGAA